MMRLPCQPSPCLFRRCCHDLNLHHYLGGSGSAYIYGFCDKNWRPDFTEQQCKDFVLKAVTLAIGRDGSSGKHICMPVTAMLSTILSDSHENSVSRTLDSACQWNTL